MAYKIIKSNNIKYQLNQEFNLRVICTHYYLKFNVDRNLTTFLISKDIFWQLFRIKYCIYKIFLLISEMRKIIWIIKQQPKLQMWARWTIILAVETKEKIGSYSKKSLSSSHKVYKAFPAAIYVRWGVQKIQFVHLQIPFISMFYQTLLTIFSV